MAIQRSGPIKFSEIATEFPLADSDGNATTTNKFSDFYRGRISNYVHSGTSGIPTDTTELDNTDNPPLSISNFYNTSSSEYLNYYIDEANPIESGLTLDFNDYDSGVSIIVVIGDSSNTECLDFLDNLYDNDINGWKTGGFTRGRDITDPQNPVSNVTGIGYVSSTNPTKPAISITNIPENSFIWIRNFGFIVGAGGDGAEVNTGNTPQSAQTGGTGGDGIYVSGVHETSDVLIENWGSIAGGAGGGGAGGQGGLANSGPNYSTYNGLTDFFDSTGHSSSNAYNIPNGHLSWAIYREVISRPSSGQYRSVKDYYFFYIIRVRGNEFYSRWKHVNNSTSNYVDSSYAPSNGTYWRKTSQFILMVWFSDYWWPPNFDTYVTDYMPESGSVTIDDVTLSYTYPTREEMYDNKFLSNNMPTPNSNFGDIKNYKNAAGETFASVVGSYNDSTSIVSSESYPWSFWWESSFKTLTPSSNLTTDISHGGAGGDGANFVNYDSSSTTTLNSSPGSTVADTIGITTPNAIYHPAFKFGQGGQGGSGNYWSVTQGDATSLTLETSAAASGENGTGTNGSIGGSQGGLGTAINTSLSNVTITNY